MANSPFSWAQKRTLHTQECFRILRSTSVLLDEQVQSEYHSNYIRKMMHSGYDAKFRGEVANSAKSAYKKLLALHEEGKNMYRNRSEMQDAKSSKL